ncbi:hypothetical protein ANO11243_080080 [Dothideomycetidae sp. 11243]|nr:hypothetical protein ANO11243_080080 [fungal sp. No.11243]
MFTNETSRESQSCSSRPSTSEFDIRALEEKDEQLLARLGAAQTEDRPFTAPRQFARPPTPIKSMESFVFDTASVSRAAQNTSTVRQGALPLQRQIARPAPFIAASSKGYRPVRPDAGVQVKKAMHQREKSIEEDIVSFAGPKSGALAPAPNAARPTNQHRLSSISENASGEPSAEKSKAFDIPDHEVRSRSCSNVIVTPSSLKSDPSSMVAVDNNDTTNGISGHENPVQAFTHFLADVRRRETSLDQRNKDLQKICDKISDDTENKARLWASQYEELLKKAEASEAQVETLKRVDKQRADDLILARATVAQVETEKQQLIQRFNANEKAVETLQSTMTAQHALVESTSSALSSQLRELANTLISRTAEHSTSPDPKIDQLAVTIGKYHENLRQMETSLGDLKSDTGNFQSGFNNLEKSMTGLQAMLQKLNDRTEKDAGHSIQGLWQEHLSKLSESLVLIHSNVSNNASTQAQVAGQLDTVWNSIQQIRDRPLISETLSDFDIAKIIEGMETSMSQHVQNLQTTITAADRSNLERLANMTDKITTDRAVAAGYQQKICDVQELLAKAKSDHDLLSQESQMLREEARGMRSEIAASKIQHTEALTTQKILSDCKIEASQRKIEEAEAKNIQLELKGVQRALNEAQRGEKAIGDGNVGDMQDVGNCFATRIRSDSAQDRHELVRAMQQQVRETRLLLDEQEGLQQNRIQALSMELEQYAGVNERVKQLEKDLQESRGCNAVLGSRAEILQADLNFSKAASALAVEQREELALLRNRVDTMAQELVAAKTEATNARQLQEEATKSNENLSADKCRLQSLVNNYQQRLQDPILQSVHRMWGTPPEARPSSGLSTALSEVDESSSMSPEILSQYLQDEVMPMLENGKSGISCAPSTPTALDKPSIRPNSSSKRAVLPCHISQSLGVENICDGDNVADDRDVEDISSNGDGDVSPRASIGQTTGMSSHRGSTIVVPGPAIRLAKPSATSKLSSSSPSKRRLGAEDLTVQDRSSSPLKRARLSSVISEAGAGSTLSGRTRSSDQKWRTPAGTGVAAQSKRSGSNKSAARPKRPRQ